MPLQVRAWPNPNPDKIIVISERRHKMDHYTSGTKLLDREHEVGMNVEGNPIVDKNTK